MDARTARRAGATTLAVLAGAWVHSHAAASDANTCRFDPATGVVDVVVSAGQAGASLRVDALRNGTIAVSFYAPDSFGRPPTPIPCGATPTVTTVDTVRVRPTGTGFPPGSWLRLNSEQRRFEPGRTPEPTGVSEIEFDVDLGTGPNALIIEGAGDTDKQYTVGALGVAVNADGDLDVAYSGAGTVSLVSGLGAGRNVFSGQGGQGTGAPTTRTIGLLADRSSADNVLVGGDGSDYLIAGGGNDVFRGMTGDDSLVDTTTSCCGQAGGGADRLLGGPGNDGIDAQDLTRDEVAGGPGNDTARVDRGLDAVRGVETVSS